MALASQAQMPLLVGGEPKACARGLGFVSARDREQKQVVETWAHFILLAYKTTIPQKWENYGEQERLVMNFVTFWKEVDPSYKEPQFFDLMCVAGEYHKHLNKTRGYTG
jgi:hypothetical protein